MDVFIKCMDILKHEYMSCGSCVDACMDLWLDLDLLYISTYVCDVR